jgi:hypothetical protein
VAEATDARRNADSSLRKEAPPEPEQRQTEIYSRVPEGHEASLGSESKGQLWGARRGSPPNLVKSIEERHRWACGSVFLEQFPSAFWALR